MHPGSVKTLSVRTLHRRLADGVFAIPRLQREFVWNGRKAAALVDSLHRGMPIGSLMVWETKRKNRPLLRTNLHVLPHFQERNPLIWFLIDGQQRLSVIHQVASGDRKVNGNGQEVDFSRITYRLVDSDGTRIDRHFSTADPSTESLSHCEMFCTRRGGVDCGIFQSTNCRKWLSVGTPCFPTMFP